MQPMDIFIGKLIKFIRNDCRRTDDNAKEGKMENENNERCVMLDCFYNSDGVCTSVSDLRNSLMGEECPDYSED